MTFLTKTMRLQIEIDQLAAKLIVEMKAKHWHTVAELALVLCEAQAKLDALNDLDLE